MPNIPGMKRKGSYNKSKKAMPKKKAKSKTSHKTSHKRGY